jgi:hypothetical protein
MVKCQPVRVRTQTGVIGKIHIDKEIQDFGHRQIDEYACGLKSLQLCVSQWFSAPRYGVYCTIWVKCVKLMTFVSDFRESA